jgi:acyl-CoA synthetase (AMP-forming)/AMP-acid ligase II
METLTQNSPQMGWRRVDHGGAQPSPAGPSCRRRPATRRMGHDLEAVVQPVPGVAPDDELARQLIAFCRAHLAHFKCPRSVDFDPELPRLPTGKLYKLPLRDRYWGDHASRII